MNFELFKTNYEIDPQRAIDYAEIFGVCVANIQLWVLRITKGK